jgi:DNA integrity scanning protein DisA with diadenylate cyclase activity
MFSLAHSNTGAVVVLARKDPLINLVSVGIRIDAEVSQGLLEAILRRSSPIYDGAVIIAGERIALARVVLSPAGRDDLPPELGTRHRGALGMAESSDALALVSSEERGQVVVIEKSQVRPMPDRPRCGKRFTIFNPKGGLRWRAGCTDCCSQT